MCYHRVQHYTECSIHLTEHTPSTVYSIHRAQHSLKIVCRLFILTITSWPLNAGCRSGMPPYRSSATSQLSIRASKVKSPHHFPMVLCWLTDEYRLSTHRAFYRPPRDWSPRSPLPMSLDHCPQVHCQSQLITVAECISKFTPSCPTQVRLQTRSITALKCISELSRSWPP